MNRTQQHVRIACLLILLAAGVGLLAWTMFPDAPVADTPDSVLGTEHSVPGVDSPSASLQEILAQRDIIPTHNHPLLGRQALDFELADSDGKVCNLAELRDGRPVVLIFYYGYSCIHCVRHLSDVKRDLPLFRAIGASVVAVSADPPELTRRRFEQHGAFGFPVLADPGKKVARAYGVLQPADNAPAMDIRCHGTFVIDRDGTIQWVNVGYAPFRRNSALLYQLAKIGGTLP